VTDWVRIAPEEALQKGQAVRVDVEGVDIALFHLDDGFHAVEGACLHMGGPLDEGDVDGCVVTCPWHAWRYELCSGSRVDRIGSPLRVYPAEIRKGWITIGL